MFNTRGWIALGLLSAFAVPAMAQSFRVQCPTSTITHPVAANNDSEPAYTAPTYAAASTDYTVGKTGPVNGAIKCQQIAGGDGMSDRAGWTLHPKRLSHRRYCESAQQAQCNPTACIKHNASNRSACRRSAVKTHS